MILSNDPLENAPDSFPVANLPTLLLFPETEEDIILSDDDAFDFVTPDLLFFISSIIDFIPSTVSFAEVTCLRSWFNFSLASLPPAVAEAMAGASAGSLRRVISW